MTRISAIAAIGKNTRALGDKGDLIFRISEDLKRLKALTTGHPIIMGRKTYESIGRPLPKRTNIVVTRDPNYQAEGCVIKHSVDDAIEYAKSIDQKEIFIFGGAQIFEMALPQIDRLYLTLVDDDTPGDVYFPEYEDVFTKVISRERKENDEYRYSYVTLER